MLSFLKAVLEKPVLALHSGVLQRFFPARGKRSWDWSQQTTPERGLAEQMIGRRFRYCRVGHDERPLRLRADGRIGKGAAGLERRWCLRLRGGRPVLVISGDREPTMFLRRDADGVWRGRWLRHERMPIELIPFQDPPLREFRPDSGTGQRPLFITAPTARMTGYGHYATRVIRGLLAQNLPACLNALEMEPEEVDTDLRELFYCPRPADWQLLFTPLNGLDSFEITDRTVVLTTWESETILPEWARALNRAALVIVPCRWNKDCFRRSGVTTRIEAVGLGYDPANFRPCHSFPDRCTFGFAAALTGGGVRKNVEGLLRAFTLAFPHETDVRLRIKLTPRCPWPTPVADPRVEVVRAYLTDRELCEWYTSLSAFVNPSRAEAWGLHLLEAMATGRPIISAPYSGVTEYFDESVGYPVAYRLVRASCDVYQGVWAEPELRSLRDRLRQVYRNRVEAERLGRAAALRAAQFSWQCMSERIANLLQEIGAVAR